jgi:ABC-2 type transport system permease protein
MTIANLKMTFRARQNLFWSLAFPVIILSLLSVVFGNGGGFSITVGVVGNGPVATATREALGEIKGVTVKTGTAAEELQALKKGDRAAVLVVPPGLPSSERPVTVTQYFDNTNLTQSSAVVSLVSQVVQGLNQHFTSAPPALILREVGIASDNTNYISYLAPGIIAMSIMTSSVIGVAARLVGYREQRILKRLRATPLTAWEFVAASVISQLVVVVAQVLILAGLASGVFGVHVTGSWLAVIGLALLGGLAFLTIGFVISGLARTVDSAGAIANVVTMPMMFLSGVYFPTSGAPDWLQPIIGILPLTYLANGLRDVMLHGATFSEITLDMVALLITAAVGFVVASRVFRWE